MLLQWNQFLSKPFPRKEQLIGMGILPTKSKMIIYGKDKTFKSTLAIHTARCIASGAPWFNYSTTKHPSAYMQVELPEEVLHDRCVLYHTRNINQNVYSPVPGLYIDTPDISLKLDTPAGLNYVDKQLSRYPEIELLVLDPVYQIISGDTNDNRDVMRLLDNINQLILRHSVSVIIVHHERKSTFTPDGVIALGSEEIRGAKSFSDWCDSGIEVVKVEDSSVTNTTHLMLRFTSMRHANQIMGPLRIKFDRRTYSFSIDSSNLDPFKGYSNAYIRKSVSDEEKVIGEVYDDIYL
jgi:hypothetical protein